MGKICKQRKGAHHKEDIDEKCFPICAAVFSCFRFSFLILGRGSNHFENRGAEKFLWNDWPEGFEEQRGQEWRNFLN